VKRTVKASEHSSQVALIKWVRIQERVIPELSLLFAIANGGKRNIVTAIKLKSEGVLPGVFDLMLPVARGSYHGFFLEMKFGKNKLSDSQIVFRDMVEAQGYVTGVYWSWIDAKIALESYLSKGEI